MNQRLDGKLECPRCGTVYLRIPDDVKSHTLIHCSSCDMVLGRWIDLEADFYAQGGGHGVFEMQKGQIIRKE